MKEKGDTPSETTRLVMRRIAVQEVWSVMSYKGQRGKNTEREGRYQHKPRFPDWLQLWTKIFVTKTDTQPERAQR